jgi:hypothetical protein
MFGRKKTGGATSARERLALLVIVFSFVIIGVISGLAIGLADKPGDAAKNLLTILLPVLGTWVGTVLAFYFARENLEAAAQATADTLRLTGRPGGQPVTGAMLQEADWITYDVPEGTQVAGVKISELRAQMSKDDPPSRRLPIRDAKRAVLFVIHDSTLNAFADAKKVAMDAINDMTIGDLLGDATFKQLIEAIGFVSQTADISEARLVMRSIDNCNDIFVTPTGKRDERAIGWLTNTQLAEIQ